MSGELYGAFFKSVIGALLMPDVLFPRYRDRIACMADDGWYRWAEYCAMVNDIAATLPPDSLVKCGYELMVANEAFYRELGFQTLTDQLHRFAEGFESSVRNAPEHDRVRVVDAAPGEAVIRFGAVQPRFLCEGYIRGSAHIYGGELRSLDYRDVEDDDGHRFHEFRVTWTDDP